ncbi:hemicentin-2 [Fopius arisanus]|uniref:Hemicentin-2 n=1 Tax=Fopius arisanus TaxID=64838 RepID=A0A0C9R5D0_9HYME|nr:PREDICTED: hemicentin-2-like [Fopius arisanus]
MKTLLVMSVIALVGGELVVSDVDEPIPMETVSAVSGYKGRLPCDIVPPQRNDSVVMILWYREFTSKQPIFSVDARKSGLDDDAPRWSDPKAFGGRAVLRINREFAQLEIELVQDTDAGVYRCRVDFRNSPTKSQKVNFTVIVPPGKPVIYIGPDRRQSKQSPVLYEDGPLTLICEVTGGSPPPRVIWYLGDKKLDDTYDHVTDEVTVNERVITRLPREYATSKISCRASNTDLISASITDLHLNANLKPLVVNITNKQNHLLALQQTYEIECVTSGSKPVAIITWWKGSHQVKHMAKQFTDTGNVTRSILSYVATIEDDGKFLTCRAENLDVPDGALEDKWKLVVHYVPVVTITLGSGLRANDISEGDDLYFDCDVKANPEAYKLGWFKDGRELHQNVSAGIILPGGKSLVLQSVNRASAGEYACTAVNAEGSSTSRPVMLEVMYAPICKDGAAIQVVGALKPETITLVCGVQAKPPPTMFYWSFNNSGELSVPGDRYGPSKPSRITNQWHGERVKYTLNDDREYGMVSCWAENSRGKQKTPCLFQIIQAGRPYPLQNCSTAQSTGPYGYRTNHEESKPQESTDAEWLIVRCTEGFDGGLPLTSFELEVWSEENAYHINTIHFNRTERLPGQRHQGPIFEVVGLEPGRNYKLLVYAVNAKGKSEPVVLSSITLKGVAMYATGRGSTDKDSDYSLLIACFAGGITAVCILVVGVTVTLYRRNNATRPIKSQMHVVHCDDKEDDGNSSTMEKSHDFVKEVKPTARFKDPRESPIIDSNEDNPDVIPSKLGNFSAKPERAKDFTEVEGDYPSPASVLHGKDTWIYPNGYVERPDATSPIRPSTLSVHRSHDIYTRSLRVQESCI